MKKYEIELNNIQKENISLKKQNLTLTYDNNSINNKIKNVYEFLDKLKNNNKNISKIISNIGFNYNKNLFDLEINRLILSLVNTNEKSQKEISLKEIKQNKINKNNNIDLVLSICKSKIDNYLNEKKYSEEKN